MLKEKGIIKIDLSVNVGKLVEITISDNSNSVLSENQARYLQDLIQNERLNIHQKQQENSWCSLGLYVAIKICKRVLARNQSGYTPKFDQENKLNNLKFYLFDLRENLYCHKTGISETLPIQDKSIVKPNQEVNQFVQHKSGMSTDSIVFTNHLHLSDPGNSLAPSMMRFNPEMSHLNVQKLKEDGQESNYKLFNPNKKKEKITEIYGQEEQHSSREA
jgi:hypothetical protein